MSHLFKEISIKFTHFATCKQNTINVLVLVQHFSVLLEQSKRFIQHASFTPVHSITFSHSIERITEQLGVQYLAQGCVCCRLEQPGIKLLTD